MSSNKALILTAPRELAFEESAFDPLGPDEVRIRTLFSGISAGTELTQYRGTNPFMHRRFDEAQRLFVDAEVPSWDWPVRNLGYEESGEIVEVGGGIADLKVGQRLFGTWNHKTHHVATADYVRERLLPEGADPRIGIFSHIGAVALNGVHDAQIRIGDTIAVFGLGVPGQIVAQAARASGARVIAIDPDAARRDIAIRHGAHLAIEPAGAAEEIKRLTGGRGADACIEVSGAPPALGEAIRAAAYNARVVAMGFFQGAIPGLKLGEEFHHNRIQLICSQISGVSPDASYRWSKPRLWRSAIELQHGGTLDLIPLITHRAPFADAPELFDQLDRGAPGMLQAMLEFGI
ncbi:MULTISPECIES: zinc-binding dehydrogenase [unclassified Sphingopyxis]|jgi:threonine dehydrogenase-like Zn-dependent dehydrogenase|uniref:zinc-binding dehydrogenase n=1 Tax=unclassified Sphingopyxis TaxID=2614943 RepID=UPI0006C3ABE9|nr:MULTISPECIES: zinc-binding dehydrogenase [unclassified Sphingopyxis]USI77347.1 zinc-binding dehydrogenase [Sphingopyxis sp. USTB-05]GAO80173.1 zinc-type alcohol dehydrogenase YcjQ [Sphingopyxis sp. C-1]